MKLLIGTLAISLALVACGKNPSMVRRDKTGDLKSGELKTLDASGGSLDGNYVSLQPKGELDANGKEVVTGHILNFYTIKDGKIYGNEIDLEQQTFTTFINTFEIEKTKKQSQVKMRVEYLSCDENGKSLRAGRDDMGVLAEEFSPDIKVSDRGLVLSMNGQKESLLKVSQDDVIAISVALMDFKILMGENNNCDKQSAKFDRTEESMDKVQEYLDLALSKN